MPRAEGFDYLIDLKTRIIVAADTDKAFFDPCRASTIENLTIKTRFRHSALRMMEA